MKSSVVFPATLLSAAMIFACATTLRAQDTVTFDPAVAAPTSGPSGTFLTTEHALTGTAQSTTTYSYEGFDLLVVSGEGTGAALVGQQFLALCVNVSFPGPPTDSQSTFTLGTGPAAFSYAPAGSDSDYWSSNAALKYGAITNVVATYGETIAGLSRGSSEFQDWIVALSFAFAEIVADYGSNDLTDGDYQVRLANGDEISPITSPSIYQKYQDAMTAAADFDAGEGYTLYSAAFAGDSFQDLILIPVPEPSAALLLGAAGMVGLTRRRRRVG